MYITESLIYLPADNAVKITLIWKTKDNIFPFNPTRYRNNQQIAGFKASSFKYTRRGDYLVGTHAGNIDGYPRGYKGTGEWRIDPKIRGNVRGCV